MKNRFKKLAQILLFFTLLAFVSPIAMFFPIMFLPWWYWLIFGVGAIVFILFPEGFEFITKWM